MIVVCGEALVDLVPVGKTLAPRPGGSSANVAVTLGRLGHQVSLLTRLSGDRFGRQLRVHLTESGVDLTDAVAAPENTTLAVVDLDTAGDAGYTFYLDGVRWKFTDFPVVLPAGAPLHVSGSLALALPVMGDAIEQLLRREQGHRLISFDPNPRPLLFTDIAAARTRLDTWVGLADIVKVSSEDLSWAAPGRTVPQVAADWRALGATIVIITRGADGVYALGPHGEIDLPANPVTLVDTVGVGDAFTGGLLSSLPPEGLPALTTPTLTIALRQAQHIAAITCSRPGADPPWRHEL